MEQPANGASELQLTVQDQSGFNMILAVPVDNPVSGLIKAVQDAAPDRFPTVDRQGRLVRYALENTRTESYLDPKDPVSAAGLQDQDVLQMHSKPVAM